MKDSPLDRSLLAAILLTAVACSVHPAQPLASEDVGEDAPVVRRLACDPAQTLIMEVGVDFRDCGYCWRDLVQPETCTSVAIACLDAAFQQCQPAHLTLDESGQDATIRTTWLVVPLAEGAGCDLVSFVDSRTDDYSDRWLARSVHHDATFGAVWIQGDAGEDREVLGTCKDGYADCAVCAPEGWWPSQCTADQDCQEAEVCAARQRCVCADDSACPNGQRCLKDVCVDCASDEACSDGRTCSVEGFCACTGDAQCPAFHPRCLEGRCVE